MRATLAPRRAAADAHQRAVDVDAVEGGEVDRESARQAAPRAVAAAADHDIEPLGGGVAQGGAHVVDARRADDDSRFADAGVEAAGGVPVGIAGCDHTAPGASSFKVETVMRTT